MKTFFESLTITKNFKLLEKLFIELEEIGINSNTFLDYCLEEISYSKDKKVLLENIFGNFADRISSGKQSGQSIQNRFPTLQRIGKWVGSQAQNAGEFVGRQMGRARDAADSFSKGVEGIHPGRYNRPPIIGQQNTTKDPQMYIPGMEPEQKQTNNYGAVSRAKAALDELSRRYNTSSELKSLINDEEFGRRIYDMLRNIDNIKLENDITNKLIYMKSIGLDVEDLVEYFAIERTKINEGIGDWFKKAGNWVSGQWNNLKHAWKNWGTGDKNVSSQKDMQAVGNALKALSDLKQKHGNQINQEFSRLLDPVLSKLNSIQQPNTGNNSSEKSPSDFNPPSAPEPASSSPGVSVQGNPTQSDLPNNKPDGVEELPNSDIVATNPYGYSDAENPSWRGNANITQQSNVGRSHVYGGKQPRPGVKKPPEGWPKNPGDSSIDVGAGIPMQKQNSSTDHNSDENKRFLESLFPKENKFSWFGY